jgi:hypothetical protein
MKYACHASYTAYAVARVYTRTSSLSSRVTNYKISGWSPIITQKYHDNLERPGGGCFEQILS